MKLKIAIPALCAALAALAACTKEIVENPDHNPKPIPIGFDARQTPTTPPGATTRGTVIDDIGDLQLSGGGFDAWTYGNSDVIVDNTGDDYAHVTWDGAGWYYGTPVFWPITKTVTSYAMAPHNANGVTNIADHAGAAPTVSFTLPAPGPDQQDLMFAEPKIYTPGNVPAGGVIPKVFHHALSQVSFRAFKQDGLSDVYVTGIRLSGMHDRGTAPLTVPIVWETNGNEEYTFTASGGLLGAEITVTEIDVKGGDPAQELLDDNIGILFMMPQSLSGKQLEVTYSIGNGTPATKRLPIPTPTGGTNAWAPGGNYVITLGIASDLFVEVFDSTSSYVIEQPGYYYIEVWGGDGGSGEGGAAGGISQRVFGLYEFSADQTINIYVGGAGSNGYRGSGIDKASPGGENGMSDGVGNGSGGYGGGGGRSSGSAASGGDGGGGGAGTFIFSNDLIPPLLVSGGGGGGGGKAYANTNTNGGAGGNGGQANSNGSPGGAGGGTGGGTAGNGQNQGTGGADSWAGQDGTVILFVPYAAGAGGGGGGGGYASDGYGGGNPGGDGDRSSFGTAGAGGGGVGGSSFVSGNINEDSVPGHIDIPGRVNITGGDGYPTLPNPDTRPTSAGRNGYVIISYLGPELP
jgi:hypothetical protein